jgi:hypothetical protein
MVSQLLHFGGLTDEQFKHPVMLQLLTVGNLTLEAATRSKVKTMRPYFFIGIKYL